MKDVGKVEIQIKEVVGVAKPFPQGGSWRLSIPKKVVKKHELDVRRKGGKFFAFVFVDTDKGLLLLPLHKVFNPTNLRDALKIADISYVSDEDLELLLEEDI